MRKKLVRLSSECHKIAYEAISKSGVLYEQDTVSRHGAVLLEYCLKAEISPEDLDQTALRSMK